MQLYACMIENVSKSIIQLILQGGLHFGLIFFSWSLDYVIYLKLRKKYCCYKLSNSQNGNYSNSKGQLFFSPMTILEENSCYFVNLLSYGHFVLSLRWITWSNSQPKNLRTNVPP